MRVLIAHASSKAREALTHVVMRGAGEHLEVLTTADGAETLDLLLQEDPPEVALVDWDLPGIEGPEMCRLVRDFHHGRQTHVVVLASSVHTDTVDAWRAGAAECISTPAPADALWAAVDKGLRGASRAAVWAACDGGPDHDDEGPATLDALRTGDGDAGDFARLGIAELEATYDNECSPASSVERREPHHMRGAALLQAVLGEH